MLKSSTVSTASRQSFDGGLQATRQQSVYLSYAQIVASFYMCMCIRCARVSLEHFTDHMEMKKDIVFVER